MMRISIWQQFSSNHSANFTVVGKFESAQQTQKAAESLRSMLRAIHEAQEARASRGEADFEALTDVEIQFGRQFNVEWNHLSLDWAYQAEWAVRTLDHWLFVQNVLDETHNGVHPIDGIIKVLGGETVVAEELDGYSIVVNITASAPNVETVDAIYDELLPLFASATEDEDGFRSLQWESIPAPWRAFSEKITYYSWDHDSSHIYDGYLSRDGTQLKLVELNFFERGYGLPALLAYLSDRGCTDIQYTLMRGQ